MSDRAMLQETESRKSVKESEEFPAYPSEQLDLLANNFTSPGNGTSPHVVIIRAEEALIVILVLLLWVAAIALFFNRWGKIRMLEPYQPKFQAHRPSCPLVEIDAIGTQHRSFSKCNMNLPGGAAIVDPLSRAGLLRPRQNSVFVGGSATMLSAPGDSPRRAKSAMDIQTLVLAECEMGSMTPAMMARDFRRPSCSKLDVRPCPLDGRRPSCVADIPARRMKATTSAVKGQAVAGKTTEVRKPPCTLDFRRPSATDLRRLSCVNLDIRRPSCSSKLLDKNFLVSQV